SVVKMGGKYYLFTASRINKSTDAEGTVAAREAVGDDVVMLGFVSDSLRGKYRPLNGSGVVLTASVPADWRTSTYSYYAVPVEGSSDTLLVTSYMTNRGGIAGAENKSTWAPSFLIKMNADDTTEVLPKMTNQGDWIWDKSSESLVHVGDQNSAKLPGSTGVSEAHGVLTVTVKDGKDKKADKPETPVSPTEGNHSVDDKTNKPGTSKPADNNQPSTNKEDKPATPTNPDSPVRNPFPYFTDRPSNDNNSSDDHHVEVPAKPSTESSVGDRRPVAQATEIASPVPEAIVATGPTVSTTPVKEESVTETEAPKPAKSEEEVQSHGVAKADEVTKSDESSKDNNTKVAAKLATTPKTPSDSEGSKSNILSILATIFAAIASLALLGYGLVTGKIHLPKK
ncbi:MAG: glycoside hydrolase family 68 protein, partial [Streptococcus sp.]|uniref:glycoside hydrolase family 68 protein n=1 Tax=Streptococcus sp. TaxID=1306 RepID=UPI0029021E3C